ncbi:uncharacterized protein LOC127012043 [Drosophila biarmipes]|uniref:uncharacterized protein LOC127012043 n=1 Tax=Drosophila biarmipes TaxID=125945 RepID=UPI0021CC5D0E|nr:uncharacterized protein LOC127012043 [Drosophila biarmipes]
MFIITDISIFLCPSIALSSSANRPPIEAPPSLLNGDSANCLCPCTGRQKFSFFSTPQPGVSTCPCHYVAFVDHECPFRLQQLCFLVWTPIRPAIPSPRLGMMPFSVMLGHSRYSSLSCADFPLPSADCCCQS